jgi:hypothetical protein
MDANLKDIIVEMRAWWKEMMEACLESKEPISVEIRVHRGAWGGP